MNKEMHFVAFSESDIDSVRHGHATFVELSVNVGRAFIFCIPAQMCLFIKKKKNLKLN